MNTIFRTDTPDSDAVASSEDERPWPRAPSFGVLPRNENDVPGLGGGIWSTQKRGSFKMEKAAQRNAAREARLGASNLHFGGFGVDSTPSPSISDGSGALPFSIPLQPTPKAGRSLSHSQGQRDLGLSPAGRTSAHDSALGAPLGLLTEEGDAETDSELGGALTHTTSHPPMSFLQRTTTFPAAYEVYHGGNNVRNSPVASGGAQRNYEGARFDLTSGGHSTDSQRRSLWQTHLGWDNLANVNESRRHSLADIPTRRGSLVGADQRSSGRGDQWSDAYMYKWEGESPPSHETGHRDASLHPSESSMKYSDKDENGHQLVIPSMYKVPYIQIAEHERAMEKHRPEMGTPTTPWGGSSNRPRKLLFIVSFKCSRVDVFYLLENTGLDIKEGDIVIVEADRGQDLGTVQHANVTQEEARLYKKKYSEEQYKWLMMFSVNGQQGAVNPNAQLFDEAETGNRSSLLASAPSTVQALPPTREGFKPKAIKRLANFVEIKMLGEKEGNEAKAKRTCQQRVAHLHLDMEILDAEWQWDFQKLIFYYYADHYINFKDLITELYRIYKTRIWLSAINPASFSQHAHGQPPSGVGPGAVAGYTPHHLNNTYTMMYGADPDPYGAVRPYRIPYDTYTPNYPGIPGVANSFAPAAQMPMSGGFQPQRQQQQQQHSLGGGSGDATPSVPPGVTPTGTPADYNYYYEREADDQQQTPRPFTGLTPFTPPAFTPQIPFGQNYGGPFSPLGAGTGNGGSGYGGLMSPVGGNGSQMGVGGRGFSNNVSPGVREIPSRSNVPAFGSPPFFNPSSGFDGTAPAFNTSAPAFSSSMSAASTRWNNTFPSPVGTRFGQDDHLVSAAAAASSREGGGVPATLMRQGLPRMGSGYGSGVSAGTVAGAGAGAGAGQGVEKYLEGLNIRD